MNRCVFVAVVVLSVSFRADLTGRPCAGEPRLVGKCEGRLFVREVDKKQGNRAPQSMWHAGYLWPYEFRGVPRLSFAQVSFGDSNTALTESLGTQPAASRLALEGLWVSSNSASGLVAIAIVQRDAWWFVEAWGVCHPENCHWPQRRLQLNEPPLLAPVRAAVTWEGSIERAATFEVTGGSLDVDLTVRFHDNSGRTDQHRTDRFHRAFEASADSGRRALSTVSTRVRDAYEREFGADIAIPAVFNDERAIDCAGNGHLTSTAYAPESAHRSTLLEMFLSRDGVRVTHKRLENVLTPAGTFRTLVVVIQYETIRRDAIKMLEVAQNAINEDHAAFARSRGYAAPIVVFDNTNVLFARDVIKEPRVPADVRAAIQREGISVKEFDLVIVIDLDPGYFSGEVASTDTGDVYVGNFGHWTGALSQAEWAQVAQVAYHHEVAHHWGWEHDWSPTCGSTKLGFEPFITAPTLLGWDDLDADHVPDILGATTSRR